MLWFDNLKWCCLFNHLFMVNASLHKMNILCFLTTMPLSQGFLPFILNWGQCIRNNIVNFWYKVCTKRVYAHYYTKLFPIARNGIVHLKCKPTLKPFIQDQHFSSFQKVPSLWAWFFLLLSIGNFLQSCWYKKCIQKVYKKPIEP